jgi:lysozyme family protein
MCADFDKAVAIVIAHEGGYCDVPGDEGGATNYGISSAWLKSVGLPFDRLSIRSLTEQDAKNIYLAYWWQPQRYGEIDDQNVATKCLDGSINMGPRQSNRLLQRSLCDLAHPVDTDGVIGPQTLAATNQCDPLMLLSKMICAYSAFYRGLVAAKPAMSKFLAGWLQRASWPGEPITKEKIV